MSLSGVVFSLLAPPRQRPTSARHATATDLLLGRSGHRRARTPSIIAPTPDIPPRPLGWRCCHLAPKKSLWS